MILIFVMKSAFFFRGEEEETTSQRYVRLASQSLQCLQWVCASPLNEDQQKQIVQLYNRPSLNRLLSSSPQVTWTLAVRNISVIPEDFDSGVVS